jgi:hypothetical protein
MGFGPGEYALGTPHDTQGQGIPNPALSSLPGT